jgi:hypothetical protein
MDPPNILVSCRFRQKEIGLIGKTFFQKRIVNHLEFL